jgi:hypothetical protein
MALVIDAAIVTPPDRIRSSFCSSGVTDETTFGMSGKYLSRLELAPRDWTNRIRVGGQRLIDKGRSFGIKGSRNSRGYDV